jgi:hypothetical protein
MKAIKIIVAVGVLILVLAGGLLLLPRVGSEPGCGGDWPCMVFFYTDW